MAELEEAVLAAAAREQAAVARAAAVASKLKTPSFNGEGDVEAYITQFNDVWEVTEWQPRIAVLKMREGLEGKAKGCARGETVNQIIEALRLQFGLTAREARRQLVSMKRLNNTTLPEHASQVRRLVELAYPNFPADNREEMILDQFTLTLNDVNLRRHLLAVQAAQPQMTLVEMVRNGNEFIQLPTDTGKRAEKLFQIGHEDELDQTLVQRTDTLSNQAIGNSQDRVTPAVSGDEMMKMMQELTKLISQVGSNWNGRGGRNSRIRFNNNNRTGQRGPGNGSCWECGELGHIRRNCPKLHNDQQNKEQSSN